MDYMNGSAIAACQLPLSILHSKRLYRAPYLCVWEEWELRPWLCVCFSLLSSYDLANITVQHLCGLMWAYHVPAPVSHAMPRSNRKLYAKMHAVPVSEQSLLP